MPEKIHGGYYLKARAIQASEIAHMPPHVREIWDWLIKEANHKPIKIHGKIINRGQCLRSYADIREGLHWMVGWRKCRYTKNDCETATKWLTAHTMIHTTKTTRGMIITILNYDYYQDPKNYETYNEAYRSHTDPIQTADTINKNEKNENEILELHGASAPVEEGVKRISHQYPSDFDAFWKAYPGFRKKSKAGAFKAWQKAAKEKRLPPIGDLLSIMEKQKRSWVWTKEGGAFIPGPEPYLNQDQWTGEYPEDGPDGQGEDEIQKYRREHGLI